MPNCIKCDKKLAKLTKGELCQSCYRQRNKDSPHNHRTLIEHDNEESQVINIENIEKSDASVNNSTIIENNDDNKTNSLFSNTNEALEDRMIIDVLKNNMIKEKQMNDDIINILKEQILFMKNELAHKNEIIKKLISERIPAINNANNTPTNDVMNDDNFDGNTYDISDTINSTDNSNTENSTPIDRIYTTDYMQWQEVK